MQKTLFTLFAILVSSSPFASAFSQTLEPPAIEAPLATGQTKDVTDLVLHQDTAQTGDFDDGQGTDDRPLTDVEKRIAKILGRRPNLQPAPEYPQITPDNMPGAPTATNIVLERQLGGQEIGCAARRAGGVLSIEPLSGPDAGKLLTTTTYNSTTDVPGFGQLTTQCIVSDDGLTVIHQATGYADLKDQSAWNGPYAVEEN